MKTLMVIVMCLAGTVYGQETASVKNTHAGEISFGVRTTGSLFSSSGNYFGVGAGWQVRYRIDDKLGSEWFADWITTDIGGLGHRYDAHIGESMIIYLLKKPGQKMRFSPYILGGFCGDYTKIQTNLYFDDEQQMYLKQSKDRWSFATQLGLGAHFNFTERFDLSFSGQYVLHFGKDIDSHQATNSANFVIADLSRK